ncbi:unnamed protein product, partial [Heterotrigona itama]
LCDIWSIDTILFGDRKNPLGWHWKYNCKRRTAKTPGEASHFERSPRVDLEDAE